MNTQNVKAVEKMSTKMKCVTTTTLTVTNTPTTVDLSTASANGVLNSQGDLHAEGSEGISPLVPKSKSDFR